MKIIIDCGHNFSDTFQKMSPIKEDGKRFYEFDNNRKIGKLLANRLEELGIDYVYTIDPDDKNDMDLKTRVSIANDIAKKDGKENVLFLSIHSDAYGVADKWYDNITGYSIWTSKGNTKSDEYAAIFERNYRKNGFKMRGEYDKDFYVLRHTICPAVLLENGFYTSHSDLEFIDSEEGRNKIVDVIVESIQEIINGD